MAFSRKAELKKLAKKTPEEKLALVKELLTAKSGNPWEADEKGNLFLISDKKKVTPPSGDKLQDKRNAIRTEIEADQLLFREINASLRTSQAEKADQFDIAALFTTNFITIEPIQSKIEGNGNRAHKHFINSSVKSFELLIAFASFWNNNLKVSEDRVQEKQKESLPPIEDGLQEKPKDQKNVSSTTIPASTIAANANVIRPTNVRNAAPPSDSLVTKVKSSLVAAAASAAIQAQLDILIKKETAAKAAAKKAAQNLPFLTGGPNTVLKVIRTNQQNEVASPSSTVNQADDDATVAELYTIFRNAHKKNPVETTPPASGVTPGVNKSATPVITPASTNTTRVISTGVNNKPTIIPTDVKAVVTTPLLDDNNVILITQAKEFLEGYLQEQKALEGKVTVSFDAAENKFLFVIADNSQDTQLELQFTLLRLMDADFTFAPYPHNDMLPPTRRRVYNPELVEQLKIKAMQSFFEMYGCYSDSSGKVSVDANTFVMSTANQIFAQPTSVSAIIPTVARDSKKEEIKQSAPSRVMPTITSKKQVSVPVSRAATTTPTIVNATPPAVPTVQPVSESKAPISDSKTQAPEDIRKFLAYYLNVHEKFKNKSKIHVSYNESMQRFTFIIEGNANNKQKLQILLLEIMGISLPDALFKATSKFQLFDEQAAREKQEKKQKFFQDQGLSVVGEKAVTMSPLLLVNNRNLRKLMADNPIPTVPASTINSTLKAAAVVPISGMPVTAPTTVNTTIAASAIPTEAKQLQEKFRKLAQKRETFIPLLQDYVNQELKNEKKITVSYEEDRFRFLIFSIQGSNVISDVLYNVVLSDDQIRLQFLLLQMMGTSLVDAPFTESDLADKLKDNGNRQKLQEFFKLHRCELLLNGAVRVHYVDIEFSDNAKLIATITSNIPVVNSTSTSPKTATVVAMPPASGVTATKEESITKKEDSVTSAVACVPVSGVTATVSKVDITESTSRSLYNDPNNVGRPLVGVYNTKTREVMLWPGIKEPVSVTFDKNIKIVAGQHLDKPLKPTSELTAEEMGKYNQDNYPAPKYFYKPNDSHEYSSHEYLLVLMKKTKDQGDYLGFTVTSGKEPSFAWSSNPLNTPKNLRRNNLERGFALVPFEKQMEIEQKLESWSQEQKEQQGAEFKLDQNTQHLMKIRDFLNGYLNEQNDFKDTVAVYYDRAEQKFLCCIGGRVNDQAKFKLQYILLELMGVDFSRAPHLYEDIIPRSKFTVFDPIANNAKMEEMSKFFDNYGCHNPSGSYVTVDSSQLLSNRTFKRRLDKWMPPAPVVAPVKKIQKKPTSTATVIRATESNTPSKAAVAAVNSPDASPASTVAPPRSVAHHSRLLQPTSITLPTASGAASQSETPRKKS